MRGGRRVDPCLGCAGTLTRRWGGGCMDCLHFGGFVVVDVDDVGSVLQEGGGSRGQVLQIPK